MAVPPSAEGAADALRCDGPPRGVVDEELRAELDRRWVHARAQDKEAFWQTVRDGFRLGVGPANPEDKTTPVSHSRRFVLIDAEGAIHGMYDAYADEDLITMIDDVRRLVTE